MRNQDLNLNYDDLIGERPIKSGDRLYLPDPEFRALPVDHIPEAFWYSSRRVVGMNGIPKVDCTILTLFIPVTSDSSMQPMVFETMYLLGSRGAILGRANNLADAERNHKDAVRAICLEYDIAMPNNLKIRT